MDQTAEMKHRGCLKSDVELLERRSPSMKTKHTYRSVDVEAVDVAALVAMMVAACVAAPGSLDPGACVVALDVAKTKFLVALSNWSGEVLRIVRFEHPRQTMAILKLLLELKKNRLDTHVVLEPTGTYGDAIKHQCHRLGLSVYEVAPKKTHDMAEVLDGVPSMHDAKAAIIVGRLHAMGKSRRWEPYSEERRTLRALVDRRMVFSEPLQQRMGQLEAILARYWPELGQVMNVRQSQATLSLLSHCSGPEAVVQEQQRVPELMQKAARGMLGDERIKQVIALAKESLGVPMMPGERELLRDVVDEIQRLRTKVHEIDNEIRSRVELNPVMKVMAELVGPAAAAALFVHVGPPSQYRSARAYEKACGLNLKERSSGMHQGALKITKRGPPHVRQLLCLAAWRCCESDGVIRAWYQQRAAYKADIKMKAIVAVMRKLVRALWSMGRDANAPKTFDSAKLFDVRRLVVNLPPKGSPLPRRPAQESLGTKPTGARTGGAVQRSRRKEAAQPAS